MGGNASLFAIGAAIVTMGVFGLSAQLRAGRHADDDELFPDDFERNHLRRRRRRRIQTSVLLILLGLLIGLEPWVVPVPREAPRLFAAWWLAALLLAFWIIVTAFLDILSTRAHARVAMARLHFRQRELRQRVNDLRGRPGEDEAARE